MMISLSSSTCHSKKINVCIFLSSFSLMCIQSRQTNNKTLSFLGRSGYFVMVADDMIPTTMSACLKANSRAICSSYCLEQKSTCAAFEYNKATKLCCLLSQADLTSPLSPQSGSQIYQWQFVDFCTY